MLLVDPHAPRRASATRPPSPRRFRHWKVKAWKRRTLRRHHHNVAIDSPIRADD